MIELATLGIVEVKDGEGRALRPLLAQAKRLALLIYLALGKAQHIHRRDSIVALFWPELDQAHAHAALRQAVHFLRLQLSDGAVQGRTEEELAVSSAALWCDVRAFEEACETGRPEDALRLYRGEFLDGFHVTDVAPEFEQWVDAERARLRQRAAQAAWVLADQRRAQGDVTAAVEWARRAARLAGDDEAEVRRLIRFLDEVEDRAGALHVYADFAARLRQEFDAAPAGETQALAESIRVKAGVPARAEVRADAQPRTTPTAGTPPSAAVPRSAPTRTPSWAPWAAGIATVAIVAGMLTVGRRARLGFAESHAPRTAIAVLPFQNLSADTAYAYFTSGLHDELLTQLGKVAALRVIGRTSLNAYQETSKPLRQIGAELNVGSIVEGSVQVVGNRLRVIVQLVDPVTEAHLWAEHYDRTLEDAFAVESDIARRIVTGVGATLTSTEASAIAAAPTEKAEAYQFYLRGLEYWRRPGELRQNFEIAQQLYERALALDSRFALALAALSRVHGEMYIDLYDPSPRRAELQWQEAETALRVAPDLPQAHVAMGMVHYSHYDHRRALDEFNLARRRAPNDAEVWESIGLAHRRLGEWDSALVAFEHASLLDPRDVNVIFLRGYTLEWVRRYGEAIGAFRHALSLAPDLVDAHVEIGWAYMKWKGDWDTLRAVVGGLPAESHADLVLGLHLLLRQPDTALALLRVMPGPRPGFPHWPRMLATAGAYLLRGDSTAARAALTSGMPFLDSVERAQPEDWNLHAARGLALAELGRRAEALREARWLERSEVYRRDQFYGRWAAGGHNVILVQLGETDAALAELEQLLARPSHLSVYELRLNPLWDPIRRDPRFQALLAKYANPGTQ